MMYLVNFERSVITNMESALTSIIIPVYNRKILVRDAIMSSLAQDYEKCEIVVVDNCSTDGTWEIVQKLAFIHPQIKAFRNESNIGPVRNWLKGLELSKGDFIKILWSDDWMDPTFVSRSLAMLTDSRIGFVYSTTLIHHEQEKQLTFDQYDKTGPYLMAEYIKGILIGTNYPASPGCALFRRKDVEEGLLLHLENPLGLEFASTGAGVDNFLFLRTAASYSHFGFIAEPLMHFRDHSGSISRNSDLGLHYWWGRKFFVDNFLIDGDVRDTFNAKLWLANIKNSGKYDAFLKGSTIKLTSIVSVLIENIRRLFVPVK